jgi:hypothetical protein
MIDNREADQKTVAACEGGKCGFERNCIFGTCPHLKDCYGHNQCVGAAQFVAMTGREPTREDVILNSALAARYRNA